MFLGKRWKSPYTSNLYLYGSAPATATAAALAPTRSDGRRSELQVVCIFQGATCSVDQVVRNRYY